MLTAPTPDNEQERLAALHDAGLLDTEPEPAFDDIVRLAQALFKKPTVLVSLVDAQRQWFKAKCGTTLCETGREESFCGHVVAQNDMLIVPDAQQDPRFHDNPLVTKLPHIRFYAGMPIYHPAQFPLGTLCLIDSEPGDLDIHQQELLRTLASQISHLITLRIAIRESCDYQASLEKTRDGLEDEVRKRVRQVVKTREEVVHCLARAAEYRDDDTGHHIHRVSLYVKEICLALGMSDQDCHMISLASTLHDVGKIGVPDRVLLKPGKLSEKEFQEMKGHASNGQEIILELNDTDNEIVRNHCEIGKQILGETDYELLKVAARIAGTHHERYDGSGYPSGLAGESIPIEGRIVAVADVFDALSSKRPYKPAFPFDRCRSILEEGRGSHFDPKVLDVFLSRYEKMIEIRETWSDQTTPGSASAA